MLARQIRVRGRVQGVGFRYALRDEARRLHLSGWVRNREDGSVEAFVQGDAAQVESFIAWARRGPRAARVDELSVETPQPAAGLAGFEILASA